jgi:hypothetical protein
VGIESSFHRIILNLSSFSILGNFHFCSEYSIMWNGKETCNSLSKMKSIRRLSALHNVPLWELNLYFIGLLITLHHFQFEKTFTLTHKDLWQRNIQLKFYTELSCKIECPAHSIFWNFESVFHRKLNSYFIGFLSICHHFQFIETFILTHNAL